MDSVVSFAISVAEMRLFPHLSWIIVFALVLGTVFTQGLLSRALSFLLSIACVASIAGTLFAHIALWPATVLVLAILLIAIFGRLHEKDGTSVHKAASRARRKH